MFSPNCTVIYPVGPVYYCPDQTSKTISLVSLKYYYGFQKVTSEPLEHRNFVDPQGHSWRSPYQNRKKLDYIKKKRIRVNP